ncbi:MAG: hypothetical protein RPU42_11115 [Candidatus Sedimenticola sp. (ex Thyasira tokunagai)]
MGAEKVWPLFAYYGANQLQSSISDWQNMLDGNPSTYFNQRQPVNFWIGNYNSNESWSNWTPVQNTPNSDDITIKATIRYALTSTHGVTNVAARVYINGSASSYYVWNTSSIPTTKTDFSVDIPQSALGGTGKPYVKSLKVILQTTGSPTFTTADYLEIYDLHVEVPTDDTPTLQTEVIYPALDTVLPWQNYDTWIRTPSTFYGKYLAGGATQYNSTSQSLRKLNTPDIDNDPSVTMPYNTSAGWESRQSTGTIDHVEAAMCFWLYKWINDYFSIDVYDDTDTYVATLYDETNGAQSPQYLGYTSFASLGAAPNWSDYYFVIGGANKQGDDPVDLTVFTMQLLIVYEDAGSNTVDGSLVASGAATTTFIGQKVTIIQNGQLIASGAASTTFIGSLYQSAKDGVLVAGGTATVTFVGTGSVQAAITILGQGASTFEAYYGINQATGLYEFTFYITVTGENNGLSDLQLPAKSLSINARNGSPSFMRAEVLGDRGDYEAVKARADGDIVLSAYGQRGDAPPAPFEDLLAVNLGGVHLVRDAGESVLVLKGERQQTVPPNGTYFIGSYVGVSKESNRIRLDLPYDPAIKVDQMFQLEGTKYTTDEINILLANGEAGLTLKGHT